MAALCATFFITRPGDAAEYAVLDLGTLVNTVDGHSVSVSGINASGQVSITNAPGGTAYQAYRYTGGLTLGLGTLGGTDSYAGGINDTGQIVGRSLTTTGATHAYLWTPGGTGGVTANPQMKDLNPTGGTSAATAINSTGQIAGYVAIIPHPGQPADDRAFIYSNGTLTQLPLPTGGFSISYAYGINDGGKVIGEAYMALSPNPQGFLYNGTSSVEIGNLGGISSTPLAINKNDKVVGYSSTVDTFDHAFLYSGGSMMDLGTLGGHYSYANAINNKDQIVGGSFTDDADSIYHAFISDGVNMTDLNTKVTSKAVDWVLSEAKGINDSGVIVGIGTLSGERHGFMLRPLKPGDANADGKVNFADLVTVAQHYGVIGGADWEHGDFDGDGNVGFSDLVSVAQNYGAVDSGFPAQFAADVQSAFAAVPEPGSACGGLVVCLLAMRRCSNRRR